MNNKNFKNKTILILGPLVDKDCLGQPAKDLQFFSRRLKMSLEQILELESPFLKWRCSKAGIDSKLENEILTEYNERTQKN